MQEYQEKKKTEKTSKEERKFNGHKVIWLNIGKSTKAMKKNSKIKFCVLKLIISMIRTSSSNCSFYSKAKRSQ